MVPTVGLKDCALQIIVNWLTFVSCVSPITPLKLNLTRLFQTPENPKYAQGAWHVEGMVYDAIVSTDIYYYNEENITSHSKLLSSVLAWQTITKMIILSAS